MNPKLIFVSMMLVAATVAKNNFEDARGLRSIRPFCDGKGRLDDFRDVVQEVYLRQSGRSATVRFYKSNICHKIYFKMIFFKRSKF